MNELRKQIVAKINYLNGIDITGVSTNKELRAYKNVLSWLDESAPEVEVDDKFKKWLNQEISDYRRHVAVAISVNGMFDKIHFQIVLKKLTEILVEYESALVASVKI